MPLLSAMVWAPLLGVALVLLMPGSRPNLIRAVALAASSVSLALAGYLFVLFDRAATVPQFVERAEWIPELSMTYVVGVDGLSFPLVLLTTFVSTLAIIASFGIVERVKSYFAWFLLLEFAALGVFVAQDWFLFYVFYEIGLVPMFFLIGVWGGSRRDSAAMSFFLYTLAGSILMLIGVISIYLLSEPQTFDMAVLRDQGQGWTQALQLGPFLAFFIGFAVKIPVFPLHGWLPLAHVEAPTAASMLLSGILLKMGGYGLLRVGGILPLGLEAFSPLLVLFALVSIVYGGLLAWRQTDLKAMVAFSSIAHMGFVLLGIATMTAIGFTGAVLMMVTHGVITAGLFFLVGAIYDRAHTREIADFRGLMGRVPRYSAALTLLLLASMGLPGLAQFVSEFHVLIGGFERWGVLVLIAVVGILISASYSLRTIGQMVMGPLDARWVALSDLVPREMVVVVSLTAVTIILGVLPGIMLTLVSPTMAELTSAFR